MISEGTKVENFTLRDDGDREVSLSDFAGKKVVVYFYPKDDTPGCTKEACSIRDVYADIRAKGAVVLVVSDDSVQRHTKFKEKYDLNFPLLSDPEKTVIRAFGAWGLKKMRGKEYEGIIRSTFILDGDGVVIKAFPKVKPPDHGPEILSFL